MVKLVLKVFRRPVTTDSNRRLTWSLRQASANLVEFVNKFFVDKLRGLRLKKTSANLVESVNKLLISEEDERPVKKKRKKGKRKKRKNSYSSAYEYRDEGKAKVSFSDFVSLVMTPTWRQQDCNDDIHPHCSGG